MASKRKEGERGIEKKKEGGLIMANSPYFKYGTVVQL